RERRGSHELAEEDPAAAGDRVGGEDLAERRGETAEKFPAIRDERADGLVDRRHEEPRHEAGARQDLPGGVDAGGGHRLTPPGIPLEPGHRRSADLMCCQMRSFSAPKRSPDVMAKLRGRGRSTRMSSTIRPGRALRTTTRSAR